MTINQIQETSGRVVNVYSGHESPITRNTPGGLVWVDSDGYVVKGHTNTEQEDQAVKQWDIFSR